MDIRQAQILIRRMKAAWPSFYSPKDDDRISLLEETLQPFDYQSAQTAVNRLLSESKTYPSISELKQACRASQPKIEGSQNNDCRYCDGTCWIFIDDKTPGTVKRCECSPLSLSNQK